MNEWLDLFQWPATVVTLAATWLVASRSKTRRRVAFWLFLAGNALWTVWGWHDHAVALILLQICLAVLNIRGVLKSEQVGEDAAR